MLIENTRLPGQTKRLYYSTGISVMVTSDSFDPQVTWRWHMAAWVGAVHTVGFCWETPSWRNLSLFQLAASKLTWPLLWWNTSSLLYWRESKKDTLFQGSLLYKLPWKDCPEQKPVSTFNFKTCRNGRDLWMITSQPGLKSPARWMQLMIWPMLGC